MKTDLSKASMKERFQHLFDVISGSRFLKKQGLGNEVPFFICPFSPDESPEIERLVRQLINRLGQAGVSVLEVNLYDLVIELLKKRNVLDRVLELEESVTKAELLELFQGVLDPETHLIPTIMEKMNGVNFDVLFITGTGEVFPYIRSHNVLNNLQSSAKEKPTVMFFPGEYTHSLEKGASLELFGKLQDDKYYRAFNIFHCQA